MQPPILTFKKLKKGAANVNVLYSYQQCRCFYCNQYMQNHSYNENRRSGYTRDHLFPNSLGYGLIGNAVLACRRCNEIKAHRMPSNIEIVKAWELYQMMNKEFIATISFG